MRTRTIALLLAFWSILPACNAFAGDDIGEHRECSYCGMDRKAFGYSRMLIEYADGGSTGVCSPHCAIMELDANAGRPVKAVLAADRGTRELVDAEKAAWVMGGNRPGVMTASPKWAFGSEDNARAFISKHGGELTDWTSVSRATREEIKAQKR